MKTITWQSVTWRMVFLAVLFVVCIGAKEGCTSQQPSTLASERTTIENATGSTLATAQKFAFENHDYILITFTGDGGGALAHAESCPCRPTPKVEKPK